MLYTELNGIKLTELIAGVARATTVADETEYPIDPATNTAVLDEAEGVVKVWNGESWIVCGGRRTGDNS